MAGGTGSHYASLVKQYLPKASPQYRSPAETERNVNQVLSTFKDLRPRLDTYVFNDGSKKTLLCIDGTIPVYYKGITYNIPICIWVIETHPYNPPLCFVKPTKDMLIKPSKYVDSNGKVYLPYLHEWKTPTSDLVGLIQVMSAVFGESPPVFSRNSQLNPSRVSYTPAGQPPPQFPPQPPAQSPYPSGGYNMPMPMPMPTSTQPSYTTSYPSSTSYQPPQYPSSGYPSTSYPSTQPPAYPYPPSQPPVNQVQSQTTSFPPESSDLPVGSGKKNSGLSNDEIKASIRSAVEDKLKRRLKETHGGIQAEMDSLTITKNKLKSGQQQLEEMVTKLEAEQVDLEKNIQLLQQRDEEIRSALSKMEGQDDMDIDEAIVPTAPLYKQLLNLFAEEMTIEDTYYYLMEALRKNTIELEVFLKGTLIHLITYCCITDIAGAKHVRELSRKQFLLRAHIQKVRQTAGLRDLVM